MNKLVIAALLCISTNISNASVDNSPEMPPRIAEVSKELLRALNVAIKECEFRGFDINIGGVKVYKNTQNYIFDFGLSETNKNIRGSKPGTKMVVVVEIDTLEIVSSFYPK
ncbi:hypothetical protein MHM98_01095 [Psychrobium sp. MM17-31]|uniref:hypothetical protein n=1 Tax=Psychrobium sp. MM17-31 TaxID=2917758 RepID=UPI001EF48D2E|nr:hypothetical protein [Psychrobium sp. MM17-31]MCG7529959.1 hypothetical protein [Psychrobium sp. MM17-31]